MTITQADLMACKEYMRIDEDVDDGVAVDHLALAMFYAAMVLQMFSYAAITPAIVYFCNEQVAAEDQNKGQAIFITSNSESFEFLIV